MDSKEYPVHIDIQAYFLALNDRLHDVPELEPGLLLIKDSPEYATAIYDGYIDLISYMSDLNEEDRQIVRNAKACMLRNSGNFGTASKLSADELLDALADRKDMLAVLAKESVDTANSNFEPAVQELHKRMMGGHQLKMSGKSPSDDDEASRKVIWGHTMINDPKALVNFMICHYMERFVAAGLTGQGYEVAKEKDFFLNSLIDVILVDQLGTKRFNDIYSMWSLPKEQGGLGWISQDRQKSYCL